MPKYELQDATATPQAERTDTSMVTAARAQLDQFYAAMRGFNRSDISDILVSLAGFSAYGSELRGQLQRYENRRLTAFRTKELDPFLDECDRQFKVWSRFQAVRDMEFRLSGGGV